MSALGVEGTWLRHIPTSADDPRRTFEPWTYSENCLDCPRRIGTETAIRRREFIALVGGVATWPLCAHAQTKMPIIGFLGPASAAAMSTWTDAFVQRLRELGWIEGRTVALEYRWADGRSDRLAEACGPTQFLGVTFAEGSRMERWPVPSAGVTKWEAGMLRGVSEHGTGKNQQFR